MASELDRAVKRQLDGILGEAPDAQRLAMALRLLAKWRAQVLETALVERSGERVLSGPFAGMAYPVRSSEGSRNARLIGAYEASLVPVIEEIVAGGYDRVVDVGCAEGYYAVGLALRMPGVRVIARDTDPKAQALCRRMAEANGVAGRVEIGGVVTAAELGALVSGRTVILCDTEGAEEVLLDPVAGPGILGADVLVEVHEGMKAGRIDLLTRRFAPSHEVRRFDRTLEAGGLPGWTEGLGDLDRLLLLWEWRASPTPWLWMRRREARA